MTLNSWFTWSTVTALLLLYVSAGFVESRTDVISIKLEPGYSTQLHIFRLAENVLQMRLEFKGGISPRPELGNNSSREEWRKTGLLKLINPGSPIRIAVSTPNATPVTYEAPNNSSPPSSPVRNLISGTSVSPGVWEWPPSKNGLLLQRGMNVVRIEVVAAEQPLDGEDVELTVSPALGFKIVMPNVEWLLFWYLWPVLLVFQASWACVLVEWRRQSGG